MIVPDVNLSVDPKFPFEDLLSLYPKRLIPSERNQWVLLVERKFFSLARQLNTKEEIIDFAIHQREVTCEFNIPTIGELVIKYEEEIEKSLNHYGMCM